MRLVGARFKVNEKDAGEVRLTSSGEVSIRVKDAMIRQELEHGVLGPGKKFVKADQGLSFIKAVIHQYSGAYVQAVGILEP